MSARNRLRFGAGGAVGGLSAGQTLDLAQSADELGYDLFTLSDHLHGERPSLEPLTALSWIAARTRTIEVGTNVLGLPYREPPVVAKTAETVDRLSGGRLVLGLGGGGFDHEFAAFGLAGRSPGQKVAALREAIEIIRGLWTGEPVSFQGDHYTVRDAVIAPAPRRPIPIWLGSYGPRSLALTGELADGWLPSLGRISLAQAVAMRRAVRRAARDAGRDPDSITCACNVRVLVDPSRPPTPEFVTGGVPAVVDQLTGIVAAGFTTLLLALPTVREQELFAREIIPQVRERAAKLDPELVGSDRTGAETAPGEGRTT
ncbi:LLM class flavin-dependent oxidoreductase [Microbispora sp. NEAU-D428]|uniref:LLM class flavin-dependent oxidoreductase n=1 Tax=Microbispora sitophila TaxID=2771537 RepID=UPI0018668CDE|nr:LLM class flavin-dependent oxidoreductase [Microbispora sitophila]MBE3012077.1 LLM class flavin-dependent oxidoreductase [Microbispora sitophila]